MKSMIKLAAVLSLALTTGAVMAAREVNTKDFSGWMDDYDSLVFNEEKNQFIFFNEAGRGKYDKVILQSVTLYGRDAKGEGQIATRSTDYLSAGVRKMFEEKGILATEPGPTTLRYHMAITGVEKSTEDLKAYNLIPVSALFRGAKAASGNLSTYIDAMFEGELVDSVTGERMAATVRKGIAETEKKSGDELTFEDIQPTLDSWLESFDKNLDEFLAKRK